MGISESKLLSWSHQGATETPKLLRNKVERAINNYEPKFSRKRELDIYLQGSYRNTTNIFGNSDVDIIVQNSTTFYSDIAELSNYEKELYKNTYYDSTDTWVEFKSEVLNALECFFGSNKIEVGNKSLKIVDGNFEADVVPCFEYRKYISFRESEESKKYIPGVKFYTSNESAPIINYPKEHYKKGADKNIRVNKRYKPTIRIFKNIKNKLIENEMISKEIAPSYFIENLLYNVPDECFNNPDLYTRVFNILEWLNINQRSFSKFWCQNEQNMLFGNKQEQWNEDDAYKFLKQTIKLWNEW